MSIKGQKTTADYFDWDILVLTLNKLERENENKFQLLIAIGTFCGLRISDILNLTWNDIFKDNIVPKTLTIIESKKNIKREITISHSLKEIIQKTAPQLQNEYKLTFKYLSLTSEEQDTLNFNTIPCFTNKIGNVLSVQYVNKKLKIIKEFYKLPIEKFSTHSLRKTFGRQVWKNNNYTDQALIKLAEVFQHDSISVTKKYLGITSDEIKDIYKSLTL